MYPSAEPRKAWRPTYHDHHVHLLATAAARLSTDVSAATTVAEVVDVIAISAAGGRGWVRAWGYDDAFLTEHRHPTRGDLDAVSRPTVLHHRTGHVAVLNSAALRELDVDAPDGVLVDGHDVLGRVPRIGAADLERAVAAVSAEWAGRGIAGFTDATHTNGPDELALLDDWCGRGLVRQRVTAMVGVAHLDDIPTLRHVRHGPAKVMSDVAAGVAAAHRAGFPAAVHVMDVDTLDVTLAAFESDRPPTGTADRIEHNALSLPEQVDRIAAVGATVVVNPSFLVHRAAKYHRELSTVEHSWLVRIRSLLDAGIAVLAGSDSPVVPADPSETIAAATAHPFAPAESVSVEIATQMCQELPR